MAKMAPVVGMNLEQLFDDSRITQWDWSLLLLVFYTPIGIALLVIRVFALIQFYLMFLYLPFQPIRKYLLKLFGSVLGVVVAEKHSKGAVQDSAVLVSNHCSPIDWIVLQVISDKRKVICFPEGETTSGRAGLLKFQPRALEKHRQTNPTLSVQPLALKVTRPFPALAISVLDAPIWADIFFFLFSPCTTFNVRFLEPMACREDEELEAYVSRLELAISQDLGINTTSFTAKDKDELVKRKRVEAQRPVVVQRTGSNRLQTMASQVKEVLPHVPMATILYDLNRTNSVDATVANLVEGVVPFTPEPVIAPRPAASSVASTSSAEAGPSSSSSTTRLSGSSSSSQLMQQVSSSTFGKSMQERCLSLQERKQRLLHEARIRYCDRHGLQIPGINC